MILCYKNLINPYPNQVERNKMVNLKDIRKNFSCIFFNLFF